MRTNMLVIAIAAAFPAASIAQTATPPSPPPEQPWSTSSGPAPPAQQPPADTEQPTTAGDLTPGATVKSPTGETLGTIRSVGSEGVEIAVGDGVARVPASAIRKDTSGALVMAATRADLEDAAHEGSHPHQP